MPSDTLVITPPNDAPPVECVWMFVSRDKEGRENVCGSLMGDLGVQPLMTGNRQAARSRGRNFRPHHSPVALHKPGRDRGLAMTRAEHLAWAKERALEELDRGSYVNAVASMISDLRKHEELENHLGIMLFIGVHNADQARRWIEGFN